MFARKPGKGITLEMYIRNTQVNNKKKKKKKRVQTASGRLSRSDIAFFSRASNRSTENPSSIAH